MKFRGNSEANRSPVQIVFVGALNLNRSDLADAQGTVTGDIDGAVDLGRVGHRAAFGDAGTDFVDDDLLARADFTFEPAHGNCLLRLHEAVPALLFDIVRHRRRKIVGSGAAHRFVFETADAVEGG